ncbi:hypothetical protein ABFA07_000654 [Porites harrisoni]
MLLRRHFQREVQYEFGEMDQKRELQLISQMAQHFHHGSNRVRKFVTTDCGCTLVVKCHNKGSCIQGPVEKLSWLHTNFITKQRIYLIQCYNDQSQFSFLCREI